jgi:hypothetical protein
MVMADNNNLTRYVDDILSSSNRPLIKPQERKMKKKNLEDNGKPKFEAMPLKLLLKEYWPKMEQNQENLKAAGLCIITRVRGTEGRWPCIR